MDHHWYTYKQFIAIIKTVPIIEEQNNSCYTIVDKVIEFKIST